jgi:hypothetical protein
LQISPEQFENIFLLAVQGAEAKEKVILEQEAVRIASEVCGKRKNKK